ncbi:hypothetical protein N657DRAFT_373658 [Parathielavia appendiculata]|uniref:Uncharacterized protein n=1 Tax=Parathielavia appendiculata TaxID=2587402 RepID=A0AAN6YY31_9PEZI|nr:hypothetical protein N657DRAFT_373658 [Parathielavia appendiculata]
MKLNIFPVKSSHGVVASFCFGTIEGTMLVGMSRRDVEMLREEQPKHCPYSDPEDSGEDDRSPGASNTNRDRDVKGRLIGRKRSVGQMADPWGVPAARVKRQKMNSLAQDEDRANRIYFQFAYNDVNG